MFTQEELSTMKGVLFAADETKRQFAELEKVPRACVVMA
jgi:hypothetical protein